MRVHERAASACEMRDWILSLQLHVTDTCLCHMHEAATHLGYKQGTTYLSTWLAAATQP